MTLDAADYFREGVSIPAGTCEHTLLDADPTPCEEEPTERRVGTMMARLCDEHAWLITA